MSTLVKNCTLAVLAGGKSLRYPPNKLLAPWKGEPLIRHTLTGIKNTVSSTIILSNNQENFSFLDLPVFSDIYPGIGPLGGIHAALRFSQTPLVWIIGGDMINSDPRILPRLLEKSDNADCVIPINSAGQYEPLCGLYRTTCLESIEELIVTQRQYSVLKLYEMVRTSILTWEECTSAGLSASMFTNINNPADLPEGEV